MCIKLAYNLYSNPLKPTTCNKTINSLISNGANSVVFELECSPSFVFMQYSVATYELVMYDASYLY